MKVFNRKNRSGKIRKDVSGSKKEFKPVRGFLLVRFRNGKHLNVDDGIRENRIAGISDSCNKGKVTYRFRENKFFDSVVFGCLVFLGFTMFFSTAVTLRDEIEFSGNYEVCEK